IMTALRALHASPRTRVVTGIAALLLFVVITGGGPAAVRSSFAATFALLFARDGRSPRPFAVLGLCATLMLLWSPALITDVGFQLSFLGTAGILLFANPLARRLPGPRLLVDPFAVMVAAQIATVPIMASQFQTISI